MSVTLLGIDSSTSNTGISIFVDGKYKTYKLISFSTHGTTQWERLDPMMKGIGEVLNKYKPDIVYQEQSWKGMNVDVLKCLTNIMGGVRFWCLENNCDYHVIMPSQWRAELGLNKFKAERDELKTMAKEYIKERYKLDVPTDDVSDCICIGLAGLEIERKSNEIR